VSLEDDFWHAVKEVAAAQNISVQDLILKIDKERTHANLSSAIACAFSATIANGSCERPRQQAGPPMTPGNMRQLRQEGARPAGISYAPNFR
jgi:predicted DNA-binding ribbon-helix-helix protein